MIHQAPVLISLLTCQTNAHNDIVTEATTLVTEAATLTFSCISPVHVQCLQGSISVSAQNDSSTSNQNGGASRAEVHSSPGWTSELTAPCPNSCSPGSIGEVSSRTVAINNKTNNASPSDWMHEKAALRKLKMQLSLEDKDGYDANTEDVPSNNEPILMNGVQNGEPVDCTNLDDIFNILDFSENHAKESGTRSVPSAIDVLKSSGNVSHILANTMYSNVLSC